MAFPALLLGNVLLALGPWLVRLADTGPIAAGFWRLALALPVLLLLALRDPPAKDVVRPGMIAIILLGGVFFAADLSSWHLGIVQTKLANAALFGNSSSLILPFAGILITGIRPNAMQWAALALAMAGGALLMGGSYELSPANLVGDLLCLLAGVLYVGYLLSIQNVRRALPSWWVLAISTAASAPFALAFAWISGERIMPGDWTPLVILALSSQLLGQGLMVYALAHFPPLIIGLALLVQPAVAAVAGWLAFGEQLGPLDLTGGLIIAVALILARLPMRKAPPQPGKDALERDS